VTDPQRLTRRFAERLRVLRIERTWSQVEVAERVGTDGRQISRYENGHITPTVPMLVRLAEVFDVSLDYLVLEQALRRPFYLGDEPFLRRLGHLDRLTEEDRACLANILDALLARAGVGKE
jgi:transcriptional regulator with XRE-family HTH domain